MNKALAYLWGTPLLFSWVLFRHFGSKSWIHWCQKKWKENNDKPIHSISFYIMSPNTIWQQHKQTKNLMMKLFTLNLAVIIHDLLMILVKLYKFGNGNNHKLLKFKNPQQLLRVLYTQLSCFRNSASVSWKIWPSEIKIT